MTNSRQDQITVGELMDILSDIDPSTPVETELMIHHYHKCMQSGDEGWELDQIERGALPEDDVVLVQSKDGNRSHLAIRVAISATAVGEDAYDEIDLVDTDCAGIIPSSAQDTGWEGLVDGWMD